LGTGDYFAAGSFCLIFGALAILMRKHSIRTSRGPRVSLKRIGLRLPSEQFQEAVQTLGGVLFVLAGVSLIVAGLAIAISS
jgi:hypothetical protein